MATESKRRVTVVSPEPTPYRAPLFDAIAARPELDLTVIYAAETVAGRTWTVEPRHRAVFLRGVSVPGARRILHHGYPITPGVFRAVSQARPDGVVVSGWSTFASQAALAWCRVRHIPYLLIVESHDEGPRAGWREAVKGTVVPPIVRGAGGVLVTGTLARRSMLARGARLDRVRVFANTIDVETWQARAAELASRRDELRDSFGLEPGDVAVLCVARPAPEKGLDTLSAAVAGAGGAFRLLVVGSGLELPHERVIEAYVAADVFALLSRREPWGVVVNEAAACGLPLVLSDRVGAGPDLLRDGENGFLVSADDAPAAAGALGKLTDPGVRRTMGTRSAELAQGWGYGPSVENFIAAVREAV
jgi:glycosyltransferase involved in cell wall biosynthesis